MTVRPLVLSIFPGIDLLGRALEEVWSEVCLVRGPDPIFGGDVRAFHPPSEAFDGVIGGPPCQFFSPLARLVRYRGYEPSFGNLIPEFERVVAEARPRWWLMENVVPAPIPDVAGYGITSAVVCNSWLGEEQMRKRRFSFGLRGRSGVDILRHLETNTFLLPMALRTATSRAAEDSSPEKTRTRSVTGATAGAMRGPRTRTPAVIGSSGRISGPGRRPAVTAAHSGSKRPKGGHLIVYSFPEMIRLQGLPEGFLDEAPFTADGKKKCVANGVPLPMGRAVFRAVRAILEEVWP